jgi:hypothetical protein
MNNVELLDSAIIDLKRFGWTKKYYVSDENELCLIGAIDQWQWRQSAFGESSIWQNRPSHETRSLKLMLAMKIRSNYPFLYETFRDIVETDSTYEGKGFVQDECWADATIMHFNDDIDTDFDMVIALLTEVRDELA